MYRPMPEESRKNQPRRNGADWKEYERFLSFFQITNACVYKIKQIFELFFFDTRESNPQICFTESDSAQSVIMNQVKPKSFSRNSMQLQTHEVAGVKRIIRPYIIAVFAAIEQRFYFIRTALHDLELLFLLFFELWRFQCIQYEGL